MTLYPSSAPILPGNPTTLPLTAPVESQGEALRRVLASSSINDRRGRLIFTPREKLFIRLNIQEGQHVPFNFLEAAKLDDDRMVVFVIVKDKYAAIEDDASLFPSDTLISQLRVLWG